jgi:hypothetical protein
MSQKCIEIAAAVGGILRPDEVASDYFLLRVKNYEAQYKLSWGEFLSRYDMGEIDPDKSSRDFVEWAFMCRTFSSELIQAEAKGPPGDDPNVLSDKPENLSGFCFESRASVQRRRAFRADRKGTRFVSGNSRR